MTNAVKVDVSTLNSLLRGELSAIETYEQAMAKVGEDHPGQLSDLRTIVRDHQAQANFLRSEIARHGESPSEDSGAWGAYATLIEGVASLFGDTAALKALKEGEEHGLKEYVDALEGDDIDTVSRQYLSTHAIPNQRRHIMVLDGLMAKIG